MGIRIRPPRSGEWPVCRMLVPEPFLRKITPEVLLAVDDDTPAISGAIAYRHGKGWTHLLRIRVIAPRQREGIGTELLRRLFLLAQEKGNTIVSTFADTREYVTAEPFLLDAGFAVTGRLITLEADLERMLEGMAPLCERLVKSGRVPRTARVVALREAPMSAVAKMYEAHILTGREVHPAYLEASLTDPRLQQLSVVAMENHRVAGVLVIEREDELAKVSARVVDPDYRGSWVNALMMAAALERGKSTGVRRVQFDSLATNSDTLKLGRRFGADTVRVVDTFERKIE